MKKNIIVYLQEEHSVKKTLLKELQSALIRCFSNEDYSSAIGRLFNGAKTVYVGQMFLEGDQYNYVIMSYPKYLLLPVDLHQYIVSGQDVPDEYQDAIELVKNELFLVCQVIETANKSNYDHYGDFDPLKRKHNTKNVTQISVAAHLLKDYVQNGKYIFTELFETVNGNGPINWMSTINKCTPLIQHNRIVYAEFIHNSEEETSQSYIYLAYVNAILDAYKLYGEILGYSQIDIPDFDLYSFNEIQAVKYLKRYLSQVFDGRGYILIKALCAWYELRSELRKDYSGTNCFEKIWELACQKVFNNNEELWQGKMMLPRWTMIHNGYGLESYVKSDGLTLLPDITCIKEDVFYILDAKYYNPSFFDNHKCDGVPATSDVTKQINYYEQLHKYYGDSYRYLNAFLIPHYSDSNDWLLQYAGYIKMEHASFLVNRIESGDYSVPKEAVEQSDVKVFFINTTKVFKEYLEDSGYFDGIAGMLSEINLSQTLYRFLL